MIRRQLSGLFILFFAGPVMATGEPEYTVIEKSGLESNDLKGY